MKKILLLTMILFVSYGLCFAVVNNALEREIVDLKIQIEQESNVIKKNRAWKANRNKIFGKKGSWQNKHFQ